MKNAVNNLAPIVYLIHAKDIHVKGTQVTNAYQTIVEDAAETG